ncbi:hypothetical protein [Profundibacterium mesophilum]|uniref:H+/citrate symporter n=1 Tax=Profundibacterium mesophilum KAUST100406-0324 TaxID=1037889 RepID=A0A921TDR4_9RHOB|nr:hypothetical protein [Profundibacterium mesophilum]KAF0674609.1 hypothetical protein PMES_02991 [Profundibacterium mesophilum KAUST100406-0324]
MRRRLPAVGAALPGGLLAFAFAAHLAGSAGGITAAVPVSAAAILFFIAVTLRHAAAMVWVFLAVALILIPLALLLAEQPWGHVWDAARRLSFLSALLIALVLLRLVALRDPRFEAAGAFLASRPPSLRYVSLGIGGNLFGVLLNFGGLGLLLEMTLEGQRRAEAAHPVSAQVHALRQRRIVTAVMRGFATIAFWSPFGIALNTLLLIFPAVHWSDVAPYGLGFAVLILVIGALWDYAERRRMPTAPPGARLAGDDDATGAMGLGAVAAHLLVLGAIVLGIDALSDWPFQSILVSTVPIYAFLWCVVLRGTAGPSALWHDFSCRAPVSVNEIGVFGLAGLIATLLIGILPVERLEPFIAALAGGPLGAAGLAVALMWGTVLAALVGLHPIITVAVLGELVFETGSDAPAVLVIMALMGGWMCTVILAPLASTATFVGALVKRSVFVVTFGWNGAFGALLLAVLSLCLVVLAIGGGG